MPTVEGRAEPLRDSSGQIVGVIGAALDVTETRHLEEQFRHAQKMEALGQLAGGVAHDFNNLLTVIVSFAHFAREELPEEAPTRSDLDEVLNAAERGAELVRQLLAFSRQRVDTPTSVDVESVVAGLLPMLRRLVGEDVQIDIVAPPDLPPVHVEASGLEQIVINLVVNARDAMPRGGSVTISLGNVSLDEPTMIGPCSGVELGDYVVLAVSDNGDGIPKEVRERIFEPFFTTKEAGRGTGLGLSTCYGIATQAGGAIGVYSEVGRGTTFRVYLPRATSDAKAAGSRHRPDASLQGTETILVLEDDAQVLRAVTRALSDRGYRILGATTPEAALDHVREGGDEIKLILSDVVMPGGPGPDLIEGLKVHLPTTRVPYMSGYADAAIRRSDLIHQTTPILEKPFTSQELAHRVRAVLDAEIAPQPVEEPRR